MTVSEAVKVAIGSAPVSTQALEDQSSLTRADSGSDTGPQLCATVVPLAAIPRRAVSNSGASAQRLGNPQTRVSVGTQWRDRTSWDADSRSSPVAEYPALYQ